MADYSWPETSLGDSVPREFVHAIGLITVNWSSAEVAINGLIGVYLGSEKVGEIVTTNMGNVSRADTLKGIARINEPNKSMVTLLEHATLCFNICRENRNLLIHNTPLTGEDGSHPPYLAVVRGRHQIDTLFADVSLSHYENVAREIAQVEDFIWALRFVREYRKQPPSLDTLPRPHSLNRMLQFEKAEQPQPQSSGQ